MSKMSRGLIIFLAKLDKNNLLTAIKSAAKEHDVKSFIAKLKEHGLEMPENLASELLNLLSNPVDDGLLEKIAGGYYPGMDERDWDYFSQHPEYGVGAHR